MSIEASVLAGRAAAEALMADTFTAYSPDGTTTDADGFEVPAFADEGETSGKVQAGSRQGGDTATRYVTIGGVERPVLEGGLHVPVSAAVPVAGLQGIGWEYVCTAIGATSDPAGLGKRYLVVGAPSKTHMTARRLDVVEV